MRGLEPFGRVHGLFATQFQRRVLKLVVPPGRRTAVARHINFKVAHIPGLSLADRANLRLASTVEHAWESTQDVKAVEAAALAAIAPLLKTSDVASLNLAAVDAQMRICERCVRGDSFAVEKEREFGVVRFSVRRCFFHSYFLKVEKPFLTRVFCAMDNAFGAQLPIDKFRYSRPTTLPTGGASCEFVIEQVVKTPRSNAAKALT
jgi:hypothetical protein